MLQLFFLVLAVPWVIAFPNCSEQVTCKTCISHSHLCYWCSQPVNVNVNVVDVVVGLVVVGVVVVVVVGLVVVGVVVVVVGVVVVVVVLDGAMLMLVLMLKLLGCECCCVADLCSVFDFVGFDAFNYFYCCHWKTPI